MKNKWLILANIIGAFYVISIPIIFFIITYTVNKQDAEWSSLTIIIEKSIFLFLGFLISLFFHLGAISSTVSEIDDNEINKKKRMFAKMIIYISGILLILFIFGIFLNGDGDVLINIAGIFMAIISILLFYGLSILAKIGVKTGFLRYYIFFRIMAIITVIFSTMVYTTFIY